LIVKSIKEHGSATRSDVDELLWNKLPDWMDDKQRKTKVTNLLSELRMMNRIKNAAITVLRPTRSFSLWEMTWQR